jgi:hypothetical protein
MKHRKLSKEDRQKMASVGYNRPGYKTSTKTTVKDSRGSNQVEHFDGRIDAEIKPKIVKLSTRKQGDN